MAKLLSHPYSSISGSIGGTTYLNGPHHSIIARARVAPVQPGSLYQANMRSAWNDGSATWESLALIVQQNWDIYAQSVTFKGKQGNYTVTGRSLFMAGRSLQRYLALRTLIVPTFVTVAPSATGFLLPSNFNVQAPVAIGTGIGIAVTADLLDDTIVFVQVMGPFEKERNFWKGPWDRRLDSATLVVAAGSTVIDVLGLVDGKKYFVRVKCVADDASPRISEEWFGSANAVVVGP